MCRQILVKLPQYQLILSFHCDALLILILPLDAGTV
jgi:hypothetical protein